MGRIERPFVWGGSASLEGPCTYRETEDGAQWRRRWKLELRGLSVGVVKYDAVAATAPATLDPLATTHGKHVIWRDGGGAPWSLTKKELAVTAREAYRHYLFVC